MAMMITGTELKNAVSSQSFIQNGLEQCVEGVKYDFRLSTRILKAKFGQPIDAAKLSQVQFADLIVEPNEVVFVLTEERLCLPKDMIAQLSPKRKLSQAGILTLGGLIIDPGYQGRLLVGLLNFSSTSFNLKPGKKLIAATFLRLSEPELNEIEVCTECLDDFPDELVDVMQKYIPVGTKGFIETIQKVQDDINNIKKELREHEDWRQRLDRHDGQIENIIKGLESEKLAREKGEDKFSKAIEELNRNFATIKGGWWVLCALMSAVLIPLLVEFIPKVLNYFK